MKRSTFVGVASGALLGATATVMALGAPSFALLADGAGGVASVPAIGNVSAAAAGQVAGFNTVSNLADLVEQVSPSVVQIVVRASSATAAQGQGLTPGEVPPSFRGTPFEEFFRNFGGQGQQGERPDRFGSGSGFFINGAYIVTNNHVVQDAKKVTVKLTDGRELDAEVVGTDPKTDLAVVKVTGSNLPAPVRWGESDRARPGDSVFAVGSPFGLGSTVTSGIVSARGRNIGGSYDDYIQVDAPINQGNSGGPLFNAQGEVIGVNSVIFSPSGGNVGIGFSISSKLASSITQQIIDHGTVERGWLGVSIQEVTPDMAKSLPNLKTARGAIVADVTDGSPAQKAGLQVGDIVLKFGSSDIANIHDLTTNVANTKAGDTKDVRILRAGKEQTVKVKIAPLEDPAKPATSLASSNAGQTGAASIMLASLGLGLSNSDGAVVADVKVNSPAYDSGIQPGDKIVMVNQVKVTSADAVRTAVESAQKQKLDAVLLQVERRNGQKVFVGVPFAAG
jgi:serine protease Do